MGLLNKAEQTTETAAQTAATQAPAAETAGKDQASAPAAAPAAATGTAVAQRTANALASAGPKVNMHVIAGLKDALPVDFNTLDAVQAVQGKFRTKDGEKPLGEVITMELLSWQFTWVVSPNDKKAGKELVKFSDDGVKAKDGTDLSEHLTFLKADGWVNAKLSKRATIVGALVQAEKDTPLIGNLIQIDLSPMSVNEFNKYQANSAFRIKTGKLGEEQVKLMKLTAIAAKGPENTDYTRIAFETAPPQ